MTDAPVIWWVRRDLRLTDNLALLDAVDTGRPVIPVFILDEVFDAYGACPRWRFGLGAETLAKMLEEKGSRLIFRRGQALPTLQALIDETGAEVVRWSRAYDPDQVSRDERVKSGLTGDGIDAKSVAGHLLYEPWAVETKQGGFYKVYTPFWRATRDHDVPKPKSAPSEIPAPSRWPDSDDPATWVLAAAMDRGADIVRPHLNIGQEAATSRLASFIGHRIAGYDSARDYPAQPGTSELSENLAWGEISPRSCYHAGLRALNDGKAGAETFLKELVWREFAYHLVWHTPRIVSDNWREKWDSFPWNEDERLREVKAWKQGRTGMRFVDAAMRQLYTTGYMHNRARMIVASYLTKHLMTHWRVGQQWFEHCLADWDPASNALGWQWAAGSGPDATPYFRVFNPESQIDKWDPKHAYLDAWIAEGQADPPQTACDFFAAIPRSWPVSPDDSYPEPIVGASEGRERALEVYGNRDF